GAPLPERCDGLDRSEHRRVAGLVSQSGNLRRARVRSDGRRRHLAMGVPRCAARGRVDPCNARKRRDGLGCQRADGDSLRRPFAAVRGLRRCDTRPPRTGNRRLRGAQGRRARPRDLRLRRARRPGRARELGRKENNSRQARNARKGRNRIYRCVELRARPTSDKEIYLLALTFASFACLARLSGLITPRSPTRQSAVILSGAFARMSALEAPIWISYEPGATE